MRHPSGFSWASVLVFVTALGCGGGDHGSGSSSSSSGIGGGTSSGASSGGGGAGGASGSTSTSSAGMGGAAASSGSTSNSSGAGGGTGLGAPCTWPQACDPGLYCDAPGCGAGKCAQKPGIASVPNTENLACGCDHVTYWNPENAAYHGASVLSMGACPGGMGVACSKAMPCPSGFSCNAKVAMQAQCAMPATGVCWSMPVSCPASGAKGKACSNNACATTCLLIQSENPWWDDGLCP